MANTTPFDPNVNHSPKYVITSETIAKHKTRWKINPSTNIPDIFGGFGLGPKAGEKPFMIKP